MHQIVCQLGLGPRPHWGELTPLPRPLAIFRGPTSRGEEGRGGVGQRSGKGGSEGRGEEGEKGKRGSFLPEF